jgi:hypothetical protein
MDMEILDQIVAASVQKPQTFLGPSRRPGPDFVMAGK